MHKLLSRVAPAVVATAALMALPAVAQADSASSLTVVGTSDVSDSGLIQNVIEPAFNAAYPGTTFKYIGTATGTAITDAESGNVGASMLIVHAASLENQFVAGGYSYNNQPGYAIFRNDFVLAGPTTGDPAGITAGGNANNIVGAFMDLATAGIAGHATFVSRGGTPGTTVEEHQIWGLVYAYEQAHPTAAVTGLNLCQVPSASGGGYTPATSGTANGAACPSDILTTGNTDVPSWYAVTGLTQGPNVLNADTCTSTGYVANACYVFTDRGTFDYLASGGDPAGSLAAGNPTNPLMIVTHNNSASAPGGADLLVNYFHAYIVNPSKVSAAGVNVTASKRFVNLLTSPALQAQLSNYLDAYNSYDSTTKTTSFTLNPLGAPFVADASPVLTKSGLGRKVDFGKAITVTGKLTNAEIGYPALGGERVTIDELVAGVPVVVASGRTRSTGAYSIRFKPKSTGEYEVSTGQITKVENSSLSPTYSDILSPAATSAARLTVIGGPTSHTIQFSRVSSSGSQLTIRGSLRPAPALRGAKVQLIATSAATGRSRVIGRVTLKAGKRTFTVQGRLSAGQTYLLQLKYTQAHQDAAFSGLRKVVVR